MGQESPYYQKPENRKDNWEATSLPNLKAFVIKYYVSAQGSFRKDFVNDISTLKSRGDNVTNIAGYSEFNLGINRNEKYLFESGLIISNQNLTSYYDLSLPFQNKVKSYLIPLKVKSSILTLDRISKSGFLMLGVGINTRIKQNGSILSENTYKIIYRGIPPADAVEKVNYRLERNIPLFQIETMLELRGKVTERFELGLFVKSNISTIPNLENQLEFVSFNGNSETSKINTGWLSINFGVSARINSPRFVKYSSKVD